MNTSQSSLSELLAASDSDLDATAAAYLIAGVAAAPMGPDPQAWHALVAKAPSDSLRQVLDSQLADARASDHGLGVIPTSPARVEDLRAELKRQELDGLLLVHVRRN